MYIDVVNFAHGARVKCLLRERCTMKFNGFNININRKSNLLSLSKSDFFLKTLCSVIVLTFVFHSTNNRPVYVNALTSKPYAFTFLEVKFLN